MAEEEVKVEEAPEVSDDDRLIVALTYIFSPLVPIIVYLMEDRKNRPFIRAHNGQALVLGVVNTIIAIFLGWLIVPLCANLGIFIYQLYCAYLGYQGKHVTIPVVTDFVKNQGWA